MQASDYRDKTQAELQQELEALLKEQFNLRMQQGTEPVARNHQFKEVRRNIARVKTVLTEIQEQDNG